MAGLNLGSGLSGAAQTPSMSYSNAGMNSVTSAAFGPGVTVQAPSPASLLHPKGPVGLSVWAGVAAVVLLVCVRRSLPN